MCDTSLPIRWDEFPDFKHPLAPNPKKCEIKIDVISERIKWALKRLGIKYTQFSEFVEMPYDTVCEHINNRPDLMTETEVSMLCLLTGRSRNFYRFGKLEHPEVNPANGKLFGVSIDDLLDGGSYGMNALTPDHMWLLFTYLDDYNRGLISVIARNLFLGQRAQELFESCELRLAERDKEMLMRDGYEPKEGEPNLIELNRFIIDTNRRLREAREDYNKRMYGEP